jgi:hypothetical protein
MPTQASVAEFLSSSKSEDEVDSSMKAPGSKYTRSGLAHYYGVRVKMNLAGARAWELLHEGRLSRSF